MCTAIAKDYAGSCIRSAVHNLQDLQNRTEKHTGWLPSCLMLFSYRIIHIGETPRYKKIYLFCTENAHLGPAFICPVSLLFNRGCAYMTSDQRGFTVAVWERKDKSKGLFLEGAAYSLVRGLLFHVENHPRVLAKQVIFFLFFFSGLFAGKMPIMQFKTLQSSNLDFFPKFPKCAVFLYSYHLIIQSWSSSLSSFFCPILGFRIHSLFPKHSVTYQRCNHIHSLNSRWLEADSA